MGRCPADFGGTSREARAFSLVSWRMCSSKFRAGSTRGLPEVNMQYVVAIPAMSVGNAQPNCPNIEMFAQQAMPAQKNLSTVLVALQLTFANLALLQQPYSGAEDSI